ncbi:hypothetical protein WJX79_005256 [Trebouxia sp. C0005]
MPQRSGIEHRVISILGLELSEDQDPSCISVNWKQDFTGGMKIVAERKNTPTAKGQQQPLFTAKGSRMIEVLCFWLLLQ